MVWICCFLVSLKSLHQSKNKLRIPKYTCTWEWWPRGKQILQTCTSKVCKPLHPYCFLIKPLYWQPSWHRIANGEAICKGPYLKLDKHGHLGFTILYILVACFLGLCIDNLHYTGLLMARPNVKAIVTNLYILIVSFLNLCIDNPHYTGLPIAMPNVKALIKML